MRLARSAALGACVLLAGVGAFRPARAASRIPVDATGETTRRVLRLSTGVVETVPLEAYVAAVLPDEIGGHAPAAALEAQAVAARSYAVAQRGRHADRGADVCDSVHCQVFRGLGRATEATRRAAGATRGLVLVQGGHVVAAPFHAACGGRTARPSAIWDDEETPDLAPVEDDACLSSPGARWTFFLPRAKVPLLAEKLGFPAARFLEVWAHSDDGRVAALRLAAPGGRSRVVRAFDVRARASELWGWSSIRSTDFEVEERPAGYVLTGRGTGHGAGLCQAGAIARARRGESRAAILAHYYRGAAVATLGAAGAPE
ncbi:MAG: SpoIID/LytB domain-containing protein [Thermoanaerobaculia bacterium]